MRVDTNDGHSIIEDVGLELQRGEILGLVGESGSGKTTLCRALLGFAGEGARITSGELVINDEVVIGGKKNARELRGRLVSYVPQNSGTALNPSMRIGEAIREMVRMHRASGSAEPAVSAALEAVDLPGTTEFSRRYPHQLSGGQQQRVCISVSVVCEPPVVVLDEPTTGLDVVTQARILKELLRLRDEHEISMVYVTHDLSVVAQVADRLAVMYAGRVVEQGPASTVLRSPRHPYTAGLLASIPDHVDPPLLQPMPGVAVGVDERPHGCSFAPRCSLSTPECTTAMPELRRIEDEHDARCIRAEEVRMPELPRREPRVRGTDPQPPLLSVHGLRAEHRSHRETVVAAQDVSFAVRRGECVALVGESGSGKTTIARAIAGLHPIAGGEVALGDETLRSLARNRTRDQRRRIQIVFQNPVESLNPRQTIRTAIARPARGLRKLDAAAADAEVDRLLDLVRLPQRLADRYPRELSGGEQQRVCIARALVAEPEVVICDEITSALDVSVQAAVLRLLDSLRDELGLALLFITHDLGVVATIADEVVVLDHGHACESGAVTQVLNAPQEDYTKRLLGAAPSISRVLGYWSEYEAAGGKPPASQASAVSATHTE
jgi:peptide/nickel transport system ATP-binding protein